MPVVVRRPYDDVGEPVGVSVERPVPGFAGERGARVPERGDASEDHGRRGELDLASEVVVAPDKVRGAGVLGAQIAERSADGEIVEPVAVDVPCGRDRRARGVTGRLAEEL